MVIVPRVVVALLNVSVMVRVPNAYAALPIPAPSGVENAFWSQVATAVLIPLPLEGVLANAQVYGRTAKELRVTETPVPPVTTQTPPASFNASLTLAVMSSQSFGFETVIIPLTTQVFVVTFTV